jgi:putative Ca2+/H+ antiporter (TMEM165/GDT1 family)
MEPLLVSTAVVALAEIGDKTQLLALMLAARYRQPVPIILGILVATVANHALAAWLGTMVADGLGREWLRWILGVSFLAMAGWCLVPDSAGDMPEAGRRAGAFIATTIAFFLVEIGDKTQIATVALAARFDALVAVTAGTTAGMMLANVPAVLCGEWLAGRLPLGPIRWTAAGLFLLLGLLALFDVGLGLLGG